MVIRAAGKSIREADTQVVWCKDVRHLNEDPAVDTRRRHCEVFIHAIHGSLISCHSYTYNEQHAKTVKLQSYTLLTFPRMQKFPLWTRFHPILHIKKVLD